MCTPELDAALRKDGSYPSGHVAIGWGWALILAKSRPTGPMRSWPAAAPSATAAASATCTG
jgi:membrane-associated phospholipid phosphatase